MKKIILSSLALAFGCGLQAKLIELVSVDSAMLMTESKAGQELAAKARKENDSLTAFASTTHKELAKLQDEISAKAQVLNRDALQEKITILTQKRRQAEVEMANKRESADLAIQRAQAQVREKQLVVMKKLCEAKGWDYLAEKQHALFVSSSIDKTSEVLKALDDAYDAEKKTTPDISSKKNSPVTKREIKTA